jgi:hypothetical protein
LKDAVLNPSDSWWSLWLKLFVSAWRAIITNDVRNDRKTGLKSKSRRMKNEALDNVKETAVLPSASERGFNKTRATQITVPPFGADHDGYKLRRGPAFS